MDIVTVFHNERNLEQALALHDKLIEIEQVEFSFNLVDNSIDNRGFSKACNLGARRGDQEIIGFLNPDVQIDAPFIETVTEKFSSDPELVMTGSRHGKSQQDVRAWGLMDWICGCTMFVRRDWFLEVGGFDERFVWSFEDTDLCRQAQFSKRKLESIDLPIHHDSPEEDSPADVKYKKYHFDLAASLYYNKWR